MRVLLTENLHVVEVQITQKPLDRDCRFLIGYKTIKVVRSN